ncbi:MAG: glycosyltransferase family A protein [Acidobacteriaceae bacterium]
MPATRFKLEAVVVCDRYSDFLRCTLPANKYLFDRIVVVTSAEDRATQRVCEFHHVQCIPTDRLNSRWNKFCKGAGINDGLKRLDGDAWVVHLDADIWLPPQTRLLLQNAELDREMIYGIDRFCVRGYAEWDKFLEMPVLQHECDAYVHMNAFPLGTRVTSKDAGGYIPIGFFQMWCPEVSGVREYPVAHTDAGRGDMVFAKTWARAKRGFIPEVVGYHLESTDASMSANWYGRKTAPFTYSGGQS